MHELERELEKLKEHLSSSIEIINSSKKKILKKKAIPHSKVLIPSTEDYQSILQHTDVCVCLINLEGVLEHSVDSTFSLFNRDKSFVGVSAFVYFKDFPMVLSALESALDGNKSKCTILYDEKYLSLKFSPFYDGEDNTQKGICLLVSDVTHEYMEGLALQNKVQRLDSFNRDLEQFAYVASHDLHEPLRMVTNFLQLLDQEYGEKLDEEAKSYINFAVDGAARMQRLINNLLLFNRVGKVDLQLKPVNVRNIIDLKIVQLEDLINSRSVSIDIEKMPKKIIAQPKQIGLVFYNLLKNAIEFNREGIPKININFKELEKEWLFSIQDNGVGIDYKYKDFVFNPFWSLNHRKDGTGIGLALVKKIIHRHGGKVWFESEKNKGSIFYFSVAKKLT